jgi:hypothetical protein
MGSSMWYWALDGDEISDKVPDPMAPMALPPGVAPEDGLGGGQHKYGLKPAPYALPTWSEDSKVSCSKCDWHLEDEEWCCDHNCNFRSGPHYRTAEYGAYTCKDPSDPDGKITAHCNARSACRSDAQPFLCDPNRLQERKKEDTRNDPVCVKRNGNKFVL